MGDDQGLHSSRSLSPQTSDSGLSNDFMLMSGSPGRLPREMDRANRSSLSPLPESASPLRPNPQVTDPDRKDLLWETSSDPNEHDLHHRRFEETKKVHGREFYMKEGVYVGQYQSIPEVQLIVKELIDEIKAAGSHRAVEEIFERWADDRENDLVIFVGRPASEVVSIYKHCSLHQVWNWQRMSEKAFGWDSDDSDWSD